jgi:hypothetical protein
MGLAVTNMEMASRDFQGITPDLLVQMDSNHVDTSPHKVQVKLEPFDQPAGLLPFHLDMEAKPGIGPKLDFFAHQFLESSYLGVEPRDVVRLLEPTVVCLFRQIMTKLATKRRGLIDHH